MGPGSRLARSTFVLLGSLAFARAGDSDDQEQAILDVLPPLYAAGGALADAWPVVLDAAQYERARAFGLAGRIGRVQFAAVIVRRDRSRLINPA